MIGAAGELDYFSTHIRLRETSKSEDKADQKEGGLRGVSQCRRGGSTDRKERDADAKQQIVGGLGKVSWYRRGGTSVESSIPCSNGWRALVVKGAKEVENGEANFKYQDKAKRQRKRNFIRPVSTGFSSR
ncbi:hypothetical protein BHE74_00020699 [Ensete ventricosum]|nr:hypothetical protein BHE74_00020699 [Ensete ventricosum]